MSFPINAYNTPVAATAATKPVVVAPGTAAAPIIAAPKPLTVPPTITPPSKPQPFSLPPEPPEDPTLALKATRNSLLVAVPITLGVEAAYKGLGSGESLIERGLAKLDTFWIFKYPGQAIDWVGTQFSKAGKDKSHPWVKAVADYATPSVDQFLQKNYAGEVLGAHANDYLNLVDHLAPTPQSKAGLQSLKEAITQHVAAYTEKAKRIPLTDHTNATGHSLHESEKLLFNLKEVIRSHVGWGETGEHEPLIDEHVLKTNREKLLASFGITEKELIAAGFKGDKLTLLQEGKSLKAIQGELKQGFFKRLFHLDGPTTRAAKALNTKLDQAVKYQRRLVGITERLAGMHQVFIPAYETDRVLSTILKSNTKYNKRGVGAVSRFIGGLCNDVRDSINGSFVGVKHAGEPVELISRWFGKNAGKFAGKVSPYLFPIGFMIMMLKRPFEAALKAEDGDKAKSFGYKFLSEEVPATLAFIIGVKILHEFSFIKHAGNLMKFIGRNIGISSWLKGLGKLATQARFTNVAATLAKAATPFERYNVGRLASRFFAMTGRMPFFGRVTLGGFALMTILPSYFFGSRYEKEFTWLAQNSIGTPNSVRKAKAQEKAAEAAALKQKLPAAFFNHRKDMGASSPLKGNNPFQTSLQSSSIATAKRPAGIPIPNSSNFQQLIQAANGPLPAVNGASSLGPNAIPALTTEAAARGLTNDRPPADAKNLTTPATKPSADDSKTNPFGTFDPKSINPVAIDLIAQDEALKLKTEAYVKAKGLEELVGNHH
ncbi:MAG: hypothetical protein QE263_07530 [Vampirovibrionales bacterium]|nr:hypothetical protein [Vampirovibrionales bacterium]